MDAETVAEQIEKIHAEYASVIQYNNENSLNSVLSITIFMYDNDTMKSF